MKPEGLLFVRVEMGTRVSEGWGGARRGKQGRERGWQFPTLSKTHTCTGSGSADQETRSRAHGIQTARNGRCRMSPGWRMEKHHSLFIRRKISRRTRLCRLKAWSPEESTRRGVVRSRGWKAGAQWSRPSGSKGPPPAPAPALAPEEEQRPRRRGQAGNFCADPTAFCRPLVILT